MNFKGSQAKVSKSTSSYGTGTTGGSGKLEYDFSPGEEEYEEDFEIEQLVHTSSKTGEYYFQDYKYVRPTQTAFERKQVKHSTLFQHTKKMLPGMEEVRDEQSERTPSILMTGFGMRNVSSFQEILKMSQEERKKRELRKLWREKKEMERLEREREEREQANAAATYRSELTDVSTGTAGSRPSSSDFLTQTETTAITGDLSDKRRQLDYLLGLESEVEEAVDESARGEEILEDEFKYSTSKSIRDAQKYLRVHRVFECFQFIIAHLLSANAENPIEFILNLLNKCLLYRSGMGDPPLLYQKKHIGQLFNLMNRLQTGYIDYAQYQTGMKTIGVCTYNETPDINADDMITKETFVEEAYEAELAIFNELIKRHVDPNKKKRDTELPPSFKGASLPSLNAPYFIPSDLIRFPKHELDQPQEYSEG